MNIKDILKVVAGILFTTNSSIATEKKYDSWNVIAQVSSNISGNSSDVAKLIAIGKEDKNILNETSNFNKKARELFDKKGTYYEFLDEDTYLEDIPFAVFKTIMLGYGWMSYMDWKALSDSENMIWALNNILKKIKTKKLTEDEMSNIRDNVNPLLSEPVNLNKQVAATNLMVETIGKIMEERNYRVLWYIENSDSYGFFLVSPSTYKQLNNKKLGKDEEFKVPKFYFNANGDLELE